MNRGDVYKIDLEPSRGREQAGYRPVVVISRAEFNKLGVVLVAPITQGGAMARTAGWTVSLSGAGTETQGVVLCHQMKTMDLKARSPKKVEKLPEFIIDEVLAKIQAIID